MKAQKFILWDELKRDNAIAFINELALDGKTQVTIGNAGDKSSRQHGLYWLWCTDVAKSGMGSYDTKEGVHIAAKQRWVIPVLRRDDPFFGELYGIYKQMYGGDIDKMTWFAEHQVSTTSLSVAQAAEVLTDFQRFYGGHGVPLSDPDEKGLLDFKRAIE